jgi:hypothetical protein
MTETSIRERATFTSNSPCFFHIIETHWAGSSVATGNWRCLTEHVLHSANSRVYVYSGEINIWVIKRTVM